MLRLAGGAEMQFAYQGVMVTIRREIAVEAPWGVRNPDPTLSSLDWGTGARKRRYHNFQL